MNVSGCHACETCYKTGKACSFDDDFNTIAPAFWKQMLLCLLCQCTGIPSPAQIKAIIDKLYSFCVAGKEIAGKGCALIACCEEDDMSVLEGVRIPVERFAALMKWHMLVRYWFPAY